ncbi:hypothetical protein L1O59_004435 [Salmonella enterica]|uniref:hypothetical protein n=1 Tax=Salmonella enterica TaxID=28901 RepID=UPI0009B1160E|nr:hypothetical protein [Salmonella enterica]EBQ9003030.1 hypothetical protein [Salmonella enterica subsp. enterica serovar Blockley]EBR0040706.1 hypothetical protein [Salmonella enterica subsp. enterica serovar Oranienburg]ECD6161170.1 hypothetical protein [Salmonella enterica subsp. enterica]ECU7994458.1 hypothetical protein [Salmonella enterica subsp. enterica serovar Toucra]EAP9507899.1 hypothetical protein [Salmonella enterica]
MTEDSLKFGAFFCVLKELVRFLPDEQRSKLRLAMDKRVSDMKNDPDNDPVDVQTFENYINKLVNR